MPVQSEDTALFFALVDQALRDQSDCVDGDERANRREPFPAVQLIAPKLGVAMPSRSEFQPVRCFDLSARGISFLTATPPTCAELYVALGNDPRLKFLTARVAHQTPLTLVGCAFTGRVQP